MSLTKSIKDQINRMLIGLFKTQLISQRTLSERIFADRYGLSHLDFRHIWPSIGSPHAAKCCIDAGANIGQTALKFRSIFPNAHIYSFEPISSTFHILQDNCIQDTSIKCINMALGTIPNESYRVYLHEECQCNSLSPDVNSEKTAFEDVRVTTLDQFCTEEGIAHIDLLKSDTEGFDLEVLKGAEKCFSEAIIDAVYTEICFDPNDKSHTNFFDVFEFLYERDFLFFGLFEMSTTTRPHRLSYANALFVSRSLQ